MSASAPLGWQFSGACNNEDPELFFAFPTETALIDKAKAVCDGCPVKATCADYAVSNDIQFGIWGGLTEKERKPMRQARNRASNSLEYWQIDHGTYNGAQWERRHGMPICDQCWAAEVERNRQRWAERKAKADASA